MIGVLGKAGLVAVCVLSHELFAFPPVVTGFLFSVTVAFLGYLLYYLLYYENRPILIYRNFHHPKAENFQIQKL